MATSSATVRVFATLDGALPTPPTAVPAPAPALTKPDHITNVVLLGNDVEWPQGGRTDSIIIVSINREAKTATMLSLPRDLYVYIPGWRMTRINLALPHGHGSGYPGGGGGLIKDTILYNFGVPIDSYVRVGFNSFKQAVDSVGGVEVVVNCPLRDWRLKSPELDPTVEENWEQFTLEPGIHTMDGDLALWYVRSRLSTNDFERGRRQQQILRALFNQGLRLNLLPQIPKLWDTYQESVETDVTLPLMLELAALAPEVRDNGLAHLSLAGEAVRAWRVPTTGETVQLIQWPQAQPVFERLMRPPALSRVTRPPITVEVVTASDSLYRRVAENLAWYGFVPVRGESNGPAPGRTRIDYYALNFKESYVGLLSWIFHQEASDVELVGDAQADNFRYRVILGRDANPCLPQLEALDADETET